MERLKKMPSEESTPNERAGVRSYVFPTSFHLNAIIVSMGEKSLVTKGFRKIKAMLIFRINLINPLTCTHHPFHRVDPKMIGQNTIVRSI